MVPSADMNPGSQGAASGPAADSGTGTDSDDSQVDEVHEVDDSPLDEVDEWGEESFPASDPPSSWSGPLDT
jgi:hypothetical protein